MADPGRYLQCVRTLRDYAGKGCWEAQVCAIEGRTLPLYWWSSWFNVFLCIFSLLMAFFVGLQLYSPPVVHCENTKDSKVFVFWQLFICHVFVSFFFFISHSSICTELEVVLIEPLSGSARELNSYWLTDFFFFLLLFAFLMHCPNCTTESQKYDSSESQAL